MQHAIQLLVTLLRHRVGGAALAAFASVVLAFAGPGWADVPLRTGPSGSVPNPGTQQQELTNITAPAEWNVFEFAVTCGACHAGTVDQHTAHFGNWAGGNMASSARDPVFRANQIGVNNTVKAVTGLDGSGNVCFRCHSPNGWLSGRFEPSMGGNSDGSQMIQSILLSTDSEGILCESCHRAVGNVTFKRPDVAYAKDPAGNDTGLLDKVWNLLAGIFDWEHEGREMKDQAGDSMFGDGLPFGDTSLQFLDGMTYVGPYSGMSDVYFSDLPIPGTPYTGQIYAVYPEWWEAEGYPVQAAPAGQPVTNSAGQKLAYLADGTLPPLLEVTVGPPTSTSTGRLDYNAQALSIEHPTVGGKGRKTSVADTNPANSLLPTLPAGPGGSASPNTFVTTSEFCGSCHDLTVPVLNHGMPEQRTYTEWKYSAFSQPGNVISDPLGKRSGQGVERCQDCHMPKLKHEYTDLNTGTYNADPWLVGGFPYGKDRASMGGTAQHKLTGANRDLPMMMKALYPEVDLEVIGIPTGRDPRVFPGMLSDRGPMWDRAQHNTEITLRDGVDVRITQAPTEVADQPGVYEMKVKVLNKSGHRIPSGYPDGRRFWLSVDVKGATGSVYKSGVYDEANAELRTDDVNAFNRSLTNVIDTTAPNAANAVMVYERVTGLCVSTDSTKNSTILGAPFIYPDPTAGLGAPIDHCAPSASLLNNFILFDNRIPPKGLDYAQARLAGVKFWNYGAGFVPSEDGSRYNADQLANGYDQVTYRFNAAPGQVLNASVDLMWQTHTREFMEHLRNQDASTVRPEGPPNPADPLYPAAPNYLSNSINGLPLTSYTALDGSALNDNWGGVAYAAWLATGKGAPYRVDRDDTAVVAAPAAVAGVTVVPTGEIDPVTMVPDVFSATINWQPVAGADGYEIWVLYGKPDAINPGQSTASADWDRLAVVDADTTSFIERVLNPDKTYGFKIVAFNGKGRSADSNVVSYKSGGNLPSAPISLTASKAAPESGANSIALTWWDTADNEARFEVWRFPGILNGMPFGQATKFNAIISQTAGPVGGQPVTGINSWVDADPALAPDTCYYYRVRSMTDGGDVSIWTDPLVQGCTVAGVPTQNLAAAPNGGYRVDLSWTTNVAATSYEILRNNVRVAVVTAKNYVDTTVVPATTYSYTVKAWSGANATGTVLVESTLPVTMPAIPVTPTNVLATINGTQADLSWVHNGLNADGFVVERSTVSNGVNSGYIPIPIAGIVVPPNVTTFADLDVTEMTTFQYRVKAIRAIVGDSPYAVSNPVTTGLYAPTNLSAVTLVPPAATTVSVTVKWVDVSKKETNYKVERCIGSTNFCNNNANWFVLDAGLAANTQQFVDNTQASSTNTRTFRYRVTATAGAVSSQSVVTVVTVVRTPGAPTNLAVADVGGNNHDTLRVTFRNNVTSPVGYQLARCTGGSTACGGNPATNVNWTVLPSAVGTGNQTVNNSGLAVGTTYYYEVRAYNAGGWSNWSGRQSRQVQ